MSFKPTRPGERLRRCVDCGGWYEPASRTQKRCSACREKHERERKKGGSNGKGKD